MVKKNKSETPRCEYKGCLPHPAVPAYLLIWSLPSGPVVKWSCADHRFTFGGNRSYAVAKFECFANDQPSRSQELAALLDVPDEARLGDDAEEGLATCVDPQCLNRARRGEFCNECQSRWENEQRAKALSERRSINVRRGF